MKGNYRTGCPGVKIRLPVEILAVTTLEQGRERNEVESQQGRLPLLCWDY